MPYSLGKQLPMPQGKGMNEINHNIALLIDGDNAQSKYLQDIIDETSTHGRITIKRIYGDWTSSRMANWKEKLSTYSIKPIQKFAHAKGKNATDIALIIDAMDILHREKINGFCIVSSDSDFTGLANRIRESAMFVIGIGAKHTPKSFINACDIFTFTENFDKTEGGKQNAPTKIDIPFLRKAYAMVELESGKAFLSRVVETIRKLDSSFDTRTFGFKNYNAMFKHLVDDFEIIYHNDNSTVYISDKKKP